MEFRVGLLGLALAFGLSCSNGGTSPSGPAITVPPTSQTLPSGGLAQFTVTATGNPAPTCTWERSDDQGVTWTVIAGASGPAYAFTVQRADRGAQFRVIADNGLGRVTSDPATLTEVPAVYVGGCLDLTGPASGYWQNGTWIGLEGAGGEVHALALSGAEVLAGGFKSALGGAVGYWRGGAWVDLPRPPGTTGGILYALLADGPDLYAGGYQGSGAGYWRNGAWVDLALPPGADRAGILSLVADGGEIYAAGWVQGPPMVPGYWRHGAWVPLAPPPGATGGLVAALAVDGGTVLAAGRCLDGSGMWLPGYWLDGLWAPLPLPAGAAGGSVTAWVALGGESCLGGFVQGARGNLPGYWLGGRWTALALPAGAEYGGVQALAAVEGRLYAAGVVGALNRSGNPADASPGYWVDGVWQALPDFGSSYSYANALVVVP